MEIDGVKATEYMQIAATHNQIFILCIMKLDGFKADTAAEYMEISATTSDNINLNMK